MNTRRSEGLFRKMKELTPGGVSSPVRVFSPYPLFFESGKGCMIRDIDGNAFIDLCMAYGPLILGHADTDVADAVRGQIEKGSAFGAPSEPEFRLISMLTERVPCAEMVRLTNSGTEATMHAIRLARGHTSKNGVVKIRGGFHGSHDTVLAASAPGSTGHAEPSSKGIPEGSVVNTYEMEYNDPGQLESLLSENDGIAAVIMEPVMGNVGVITPEKDYLRKIRKITSDNEVLLIFDEVITGSRLSKGGAQEMFNVKPDLCTMGKIIGGGLPVGAIAGKKEIMEGLAPSGKVYQAGTFSGNPLTAAAGVATLSKMDADAYSKLNNNSDKLVKAIRDSLADLGVNGCVQSAGSMFQVFFGIAGARNGTEAKNADQDMFRRMFSYFLKNGIYLPPSAFEVNFLSVSHYGEPISKTEQTFDGFLKEVSR